MAGAAVISCVHYTLILPMIFAAEQSDAIYKYCINVIGSM